jgi:class 3 adenylate cyclase/tetratricopeptide (TPR) repeat protein
MPCARCDADNPTGARFCSACGASLEHACAHCGAALLDGQRFCNACGHDLGASAAPAIDEGERRNATVMFSDLSGYTALNEASDPEDVEAIMGRIKAEATIVIERHGGTVNQFVGDEIMALFGVPLARRDDPRRAVAAALELHDAVRRLVAGVEAPPARELQMHTGINTGLVVARRSDARAGDYALTGDAVNIAARLRSLAAPGEVLVSAETWQQVSDHFEAEAGAPVEVKGKERPLSPYRIRGARAAPAPGGGSLVGRDEELRDFAALASACVERKRSRVVVVRGDPGVGKSRLVAEFATAARTLGFSCHCATVLDFGAQTGRDAVRSLARSLLGVASTAEEAERRAAIESAGAARPDAADRRLFLYDLLDVTPPPELRALAAAMSTAAREQGSLHAVCDLAASAGTTAPLLLVVEDIHWADAWTLERLAALALLAAKQPLLLVMTTRFAGDPTAGAWRTVLHGAPLIGIDLAPLGAEDASRLATQAAAALPPALIASCVERAEGNPLFLLQLLLNAGETAQSSLPGSIQALVHARMDRLAGEDKVALQAAAVLGQRYTAEALRYLLDNPGYDGRHLVENFLVRADGSEFMFCHALIRDGAYESLLHKRRRLLHARAAEWFESRDLVLAAQHYDRAEDARAAEAYLAAGNSVAAQFRHADALALIERGLRLAAAREIRFALLMARGRLMVELGRSSEAIEACRAALEAAAGPGERAQALIATAAGMRLNDRIAEGLAALDEAEPLAAAASIPLGLSRLHHLRGNLLFPLGRHAECLHEHELARQHAREGGSLEAEAAALGGLGDAFYLQGRMRSAHQQFLECVALAREHGFGRLEIANLPMVGWSGMHLLDIDAVVVVAREAIELAQRASQPRAELMSRVLLAWSEGLIRDRRDEAEQQTEAALRLARTLGAKRFEGQLHAMNASIALRQGDRQRALQLAEEALAVCREHGMGHIGPWVHGVRALVETDPQARVQLLQEGERQLALGCVSHNHIHLRELAVDVCLEVGAWDEAEQNCQRILDYTADEPLPLAAFIVARGRALARFGRGERSAALRADLADLADLAGRAGLNFARIALDEALDAFGEAAVTATNV